MKTDLIKTDTDKHGILFQLSDLLLALKFVWGGFYELF